MARFARIVVPEVPHHVTQRGARRMQVFFSNRDYRAYKEILARKARKYGLAIWTYCLMPNHVHLIAVPSDQRGLARPIGETHYSYAREVNKAHGWTGHLWQERFASFPMDEAHLLAAVRYVLLNPVRAGLAPTATAWPHSSARVHVLGETDALVDPTPCLQRIADWARYLEEDAPYPEETAAVRCHGHLGRPLGSARFVAELEALTGRRLRPHKVGRKAKE